MKKVICQVLLILLIISTLTLVFKIHQVKAELPSDMPVVFVDPLNVYESVGDTFTVAVKVFNLTCNFYQADEEWMPGDPLPPPGFRYTFSLGNLYSFDISMSWDPTVLEYVSHEVMVPRNATFPDGILNAPADKIEESVNPTAGTFVVGYGSRLPAEEFNCPDDNATVLEITFNVVKEGACCLSLDEVTLYQRKLKFPQAMHKIPHWKINGQFETPGARTRIVGLEVQALVGTQLYEPPLIQGENGKVRITVRNDGMVTDTYTLTLYNGSTPLTAWQNMVIDSGESLIHNYTFSGEDFKRGLFNLTAVAQIWHNSQLFDDVLPTQFRVVDTPIPKITLSMTQDTVNLDASESIHQDPDGSIVNYTWLMYEPDATQPRQSLQGKEVSYCFDKNGTWRIVLVVKDNWQLTYNENRSATESYKAEVTLSVEPVPPTISIMSPGNKTYSTSDVPLTFIVDEATSWIGYCLDAQENVTITGNITLPTSSEGPHSIVVFASDTGGNTGSSSIVYFSIDTISPNVEILSPKNRTYSTSSVSLSFTVDESTSLIGYILDGGVNQAIPDDGVISGLSDGSHRIAVYARDAAGNTGMSSTIYFSIETQPLIPFSTWIVVVTMLGVGAIAAALIYRAKIRKATDKAESHVSP